MGPSKDGVSYVVELVSRMPIIVESVFKRKKIEMGVPKSSTWVLPKQIYSMNEKNMVSRNDNSTRKLLCCVSPNKEWYPRKMVAFIY